MSKKSLLFLFNPYSGTGAIKSQLFSVIDTMVKAGFDVTVYPTQCQGDARVKAALEAKSYDRIVCSGGDGTLDEVVCGVLEAGADVPIGYIPTGSTNDFASSIGIDSNIKRATEIASKDNIFPCDIGKFNQDYFIYIAAFGLFTEVSYNTDQTLKNIFGHAAYIIEGAKEIFNVSTFHLRVEYGNEYIEDNFIYGMITNSHSVGGFKNIIPTDVGLNDGVFEVTLIKPPKDLIQLADILNFLNGITNHSKYVYAFHASELYIECQDEIPWTLDGEFGGKHRQLTIKNCHKAVNFLVE